jgi:type II secretory pathway predicted ATPase ExeA
MYRSHYNLKKKPFEPSPDPKFMWLSDKQIEIISRLAKTIQRDGGILLLTGDIGMGNHVYQLSCECSE